MARKMLVTAAVIDTPPETMERGKLDYITRTCKRELTNAGCPPYTIKYHGWNEGGPDFESPYFVTSVKGAWYLAVTGVIEEDDASLPPSAAIRNAVPGPAAGAGPAAAP